MWCSLNIRVMAAWKKIIGILGGMGPVASADTYASIVRFCQENYQSCQDDEFPTIVLYSLPIPEFSHLGFTDQEKDKLVSKLILALKKLERAGASLILMDCNTIHYFYNQLQEAIKTPIINLISLTSQYITAYYPESKIGVLCSQTSKDLKLYSSALSNQVIETSELEQTWVNKIILSVMAGKNGPSHLKVMNQIIANLKSRGADHIILGCTEISNMYHGQINTFIDSEQIAIKELLEQAKS